MTPRRFPRNLPLLPRGGRIVKLLGIVVSLMLVYGSAYAAAAYSKDAAQCTDSYACAVYASDRYDAATYASNYDQYAAYEFDGSCDNYLNDEKYEGYRTYEKYGSYEKYGQYDVYGAVAGSYV